MLMTPITYRHKPFVSGDDMVSMGTAKNKCKTIYFLTWVN